VKTVWLNAGSRKCAPDDGLREAIHLAAQRKHGLLRRFAPRNDGSLISNSKDNSGVEPSLRANGSRECAPDDRLREAIHLAAQRKKMDCFVAPLLAMTATVPRRTTPSYPAQAGDGVTFEVQRLI